MPTIAAVRPVLLSAPYADPDNTEVQVHLPTGWRTTGLVEIALDDGSVGWGEAYLAVFAPAVFTEIVELLVPHLVGAEALDVPGRHRDVCDVTAYWSLTGAARHVVGAVEAALWDAVGKHLGKPVHELLGGARTRSVPLYGSGGDSATPAAMEAELAVAADLGIRTVKIRARHGDADKVCWTAGAAGALGISVAVDMCQNLAVHGGSADDALAFLARVAAGTPAPLAFLEEPLGLDRLEEHPRLRAAADVPIAGGEIVTSPGELVARVRAGYYDLVQPDATVIGGIGATAEVFAAAPGSPGGCRTVVHCWGSAVGMAANYHAAFAGGGTLAEWPLPAYPLRTELLVEPLQVVDGELAVPTAPGLGVHLPPEVERRYPFRPDAVYRTRPTGPAVPQPVPASGAWNR